MSKVSVDVRIGMLYYPFQRVIYLHNRLGNPAALLVWQNAIVTNSCRFTQHRLMSCYCMVKLLKILKIV